MANMVKLLCAALLCGSVIGCLMLPGPKLCGRSWINLICGVFVGSFCLVDDCLMCEWVDSPHSLL